MFDLVGRFFSAFSPLNDDPLTKGRDAAPQVVDFAKAGLDYSRLVPSVRWNMPFPEVTGAVNGLMAMQDRLFVATNGDAKRANGPWTGVIPNWALEKTFTTGGNNMEKLRQ